MEAIVSDVINIIEEGRRKAYQAINITMVQSIILADWSTYCGGRTKGQCKSGIWRLTS